MLEADICRAAPSLQRQDVSHLVPPTLSFANGFVQTLSDSGWSIERVGVSIYNGGMAGTTKAAWIKTDKGVLEVLFYETSAEVEKIQLEENDGLQLLAISSSQVSDGRSLIGLSGFEVTASPVYFSEDIERCSSSAMTATWLMR